MCVSVAVVTLLTAMGCGDGAGNGAEDTGSIMLVSVTSIDRNVDIAPDWDKTSDPQTDPPDNPLHDQLISMSFTNRSVVPGIDKPTTSTDATTDTDTFLQVVSYTIDYSTSDPTAPPLQSRTYYTGFWDGLVTNEETVTRPDIILASLDTIYEYDAKAGPGALSVVPEYVARYTFHIETSRFGETMTAKVSVSFSFGNFLPQ